MRENYFVGALLPDLNIGTTPELSFNELMQLLNLNLAPKDKEQVAVLRRFYDIYHASQGKALSEKGNLNENELEEALAAKVGLPDYFIEGLEQKAPLAKLLSRYYEEEIAQSTGFLKSLLKMERDLRLILTAVRAKKLNRPIAQELQFENPHDELMEVIMAGYDLPEGYSEFIELYEKYSNSPLEWQNALSEWKFNKIAEMEGTDPFSIDKILGYTARLLLVENQEKS